MAELPEVKVNRKGAARIASGHPWIFSSDIVDRGNAAPGDAVRVTEAAGRTIGAAHYSSTSEITLRMLSPFVEAVDRSFFRSRLKAAANHRDLVVSNSTAFRLVYGEADLLPGLVVDRYGSHLVVQALNQGMDRALDLIVDCLVELFQPESIVARHDVSVRAKESLALETKVLAGAPGKVRIEMNGLRFIVDLLGGQKTGAFLDQRENYVAAARWARGKALDCFTSSGGFALHIASGCEAVEAVDSSKTALEAAQANIGENRISNVAVLEANVFDLLAGHDAAGRQFQTIILDPPAFAKSRANLEGALRGYKEINLRALKLLESGGVLVSCCCSHHVSEAMLLEVIAKAALDARRQVRVLDRRTQSLDHPILLTVPETHYLKCLILQVL
ncbi:MAG: class I SAM-dependent rRNA methyltransferase [Acidobacteria bacterium]|nr:class I SAM-dependent rRNA methyltransferase [Acidobacteriota bacterium]